MKNLFFLTVFSVGCVVCNAQNLYFWSGGKKIWLDTDSTKMIVQFDNEQNLEGFMKSITSSSKFPTQSPLALVWQQSKSDDETFCILNTEKSVVNKTFANKFHNSDTPFLSYRLYFIGA